MSVSPSSITIVILFLTVAVLFAVSHHLRGELAKARQETADIHAQLTEAIAQRDADRRRIIDAAKRLDEALTLFVNNSEEAHYDHEERMESMAEIETPEAVDWLCEPVPDDIRRLFGCDTADEFGARSEARPTDGIDAAVH